MFCIHCGKELEDGSVFCAHCGKRLEDDKSEEIKPDSDSPVKAVPESAVEAAKEKVEKAIEAVNETIGNAALKNEAELPEKPVDEPREAKDPIETIPEIAAAKEKVEKAIEAANETVGEPREAEDPIETIPEIAAAKENVEKAIETVSDTAGDTTPKDTAELPENHNADEKTEETPPEEIPFENDNGAVSKLSVNKTALTVTAALLAFVLLVAVAAASISMSGGSGIKGSYLLHEDSGESIAIYNGKKINSLDLSKNADIVTRNLDGSKAVVKDDTALYYLDNGRSTKITEDFDGTITISDDGGTVVYPYDGSLYTYRNGEKKKIADFENELCTLVISPNGDTIAYSEQDGDKISTYAYTGGKLVDLDAKIAPISVSNRGGIIYGVDKKLRLCCIKKLKPDSSESVKNINTDIAPFFSTDKKQILFTSDNGVYYFDSSLDEEIKITGKKIELIYPECSVRSYNSFKSFIAYSDGKLIKFTRNGDDFDKETLASAYGCILSADGKRLVYIQDNELYRINVADPDKKTKLGNEVINFGADKDLKHVYFIDQDKTLRYADGKSKSGRKVIDDVGDFTVNPDGVCVFTDDDNTLYYSARGGNKTKAGLEDVKGNVGLRNNTVYVVSEGDLYVSTDGRSFAKP